MRSLFLSTSALAAGTGVYTWRFEPHWVQFVHQVLPIAYLPIAWAGKRLVQISDLHIGPRVSDAFLLQTLARVKSLSPALVAYTGDFTSHEPHLAAHIESIFPHLPKGAQGTFGVLGNHDYGLGWSQPEVADRIASLASDCGVSILRNQVAAVDGLQIAGFDDAWANRFHAQRSLASLDKSAASLALSHNPDTADEPVWEGYSGWILSGHTHGGQCKPPFLPAPLLPVKNRRYTSGVFALSGQRQMYINRGLGHLLRVRFNVRPEITVFELKAA